MRTFATNDGTEWVVVVNVLTIKRVQDHTGLKLTDLFSTAEKVQAFFADEVRLCEVLYATVLPQAEQAGKTIDDFLATIDDAVIEKAMDALVEEIVDFFREPRKGLLKKVLAKYRDATSRLETAGVRDFEKKLSEVDFETLFRQTHTSSASSSPVPAA